MARVTLEVGDILEIPLSNGHRAYAQYVFWSRLTGPFVREFDLVSDDRVEIDALTRARPLSPRPLAVLFAGVAGGLWEVIGPMPVADLDYRQITWPLYVGVLRSGAAIAVVGSALLALVGLLLPWRAAAFAGAMLAAFAGYYLVLRMHALCGGVSPLMHLSVWGTALLTALLDANLQTLACGLQSWAARVTGLMPLSMDCDPGHRGYVSATSIFILLFLTFVEWAQVWHGAWKTRRRLGRRRKEGPADGGG